MVEEVQAKSLHTEATHSPDVPQQCRGKEAWIAYLGTTKEGAISHTKVGESMKKVLRESYLATYKAVFMRGLTSWLKPFAGRHSCNSVPEI